LKKIVKRILAVTIAAVILVTFIAGCRKNDSTDFEVPEFVFVADTVPLSADLEDIRNLTFFDGKFYFWSYVIISEDPWEMALRLYSMEMDGSNLTELPNYKPLDPPFENAEGSSHISSMIVTDEGIWLVETGYFWHFNLPEDFAGDDDDRWEYYEDLGEVYNVRRLDMTGAQVDLLDISSLKTGREWFYVQTFAIDAAGNLYFGIDQDIVVMNNSGVQQFKLEVSSWVRQLIRLPDGTVAHFGYSESDGTNVLTKIDANARAWGEVISLPQNAHDVFPGGGDYLVIYRSSSSLFGVDHEGEAIHLLNWIDSNIMPDWLDNVSILPDGRVVCTTTKWDWGTGDREFELSILTKTPYSELPERTVLTLGTVWLDWTIRPYIIEFNRTNPNYRIQVIDYSDQITEGDWSAAMTRLSTDIITGKVPDILDLNNLPYKQYVARNLLVDLNPLIDSDPQVDRNSLIDHAFRAAEMEGGLYFLFPSFYIQTLVGNPAIVGPEMGWTMAEFQEVLNANPQADRPLGEYITNSQFIQLALMVNMDKYVNWSTGTANFDTDEFASLLEFSTRFPSMEELENMQARDLMIYEPELIATGRQIMMPAGVNDFRTLGIYQQLFGGELAIKGFPTDTGNGNALGFQSSLAITTRASDKDGAWEFMRPLLSADWQTSNVSHNFPTNKAAFDNMAKRAMEEEGGYSWGFGRDTSIESEGVTQADVDLVLKLIESTFGVAGIDESLMNIINENTEDFFNGRSSAQEAARIIQSRVSRYISEQSD